MYLPPFCAIVSGSNVPRIAYGVQPQVIVKEVVKQPEVPKEAPKVTLTLDSDPQNAEVFEGDVSLGTTPVVLTREKGDSILVLTFKLKGYKDAERKVPLSGDRQITESLEKERVVRHGPKPTIEDEGLKDLDDYTQEDDLKSLPDDN